MATHEQRIQAMEDLIPGIARSQEMMVDALGAISEAMRGVVRTQQEHSAILREHSAILQEHTVLLRSIFPTVQDHPLELASIRGNMQMD